MFFFFFLISDEKQEQLRNELKLPVMEEAFQAHCIQKKNLYTERSV
jgi:hypothetical protein